jgi:hypothetical protein
MFKILSDNCYVFDIFYSKHSFSLKYHRFSWKNIPVDIFFSWRKKEAVVRAACKNPHQHCFSFSLDECILS